MPVLVSASTAKWLQQLAIITSLTPLTGSQYELSYNDQIYLENGFLIAKLLRVLLKTSGSSVEGLLKVRKIAYISSN